MSFDVTTLALAKSYADQHGGGGASTADDFIIKMTVEANGDDYTVTSCDKTIEQIDAAFNAGKNIVLTVTPEDGLYYVLSLTNATPGSGYVFASFYSVYLLYANISGYGAYFFMARMNANDIDYSNAALPNVDNVGDALDLLVPNAHTHSNKSILDKFSETDGKPTYDGEKISGASTAEEVEYTNAILPNASNVKSALDDTIDTLQTQIADSESLRAGVNALMNAYETQDGDIASLKTQAHTHSNKDTLDKLSVLNGKLQYNGSDVGLKPVKGTDYWTAADKTEIVNDTLAALPTWTGGSY